MKNGGSAFPTNSYAPGMTLRDYFAGQVLSGSSIILIEAENEGIYPETLNSLAANAYELADAMIAEREKGATP